MKILLITTGMGTGGAETHVAELARGLRAMGEEVGVLSAGGRLADELECEGIPQYRLRPARGTPPRMWEWRRSIRRIAQREGYEILHAHARIPAMLIRHCERYGCFPTVTVHARFRTNAALSSVCYWGKRTIAVSEDLRADVADRFHVPAEAVKVIPNGVDCQRFCPPPEGTERTGILFVSRLDRDCSLGARLLCRIAPSLAREHPDLTVTVIGGGDAFGEIREEAARANSAVGRPCVSLPGAVSDPAPFYRAARVFVGVSRAAMEAAASGCAVLLCGNEGYGGLLSPELPETSLGNFCCRGMGIPTAAQIEADLRRLLADPTLCRNAGIAGRAWMVQAFSRERMARETAQVYRSLLPPDRKSPLLTIGGYAGCGNFGDDAILLGFLEELEKTDHAARVRILTAAPRRSHRRFLRPCASRSNPLSLFFTLARSSCFLSGGGTLLQNATGNKSLFYYVSLLRAARFFGTRTALYAAGIGPLHGRIAQRAAQNAVRTCAYVSARDPDSFRTFLRMGADRAHLRRSADPAFLLSPPPAERLPMLLRENGIAPGTRYVCVSVRTPPKENADLLRMVGAALRTVCRRHGLTPVFLILDRHRDCRATETVLQTTGGCVPWLREPSDLLAWLSGAAFSVGMRLHLLILSVSAATPTLGVCGDLYEKKLASFARVCGIGCTDPAAVTVPELAERMEFLLANRERERAALAAVREEMREKAKKDLENILGMLYNK